MVHVVILDAIRVAASQQTAPAPVPSSGDSGIPALLSYVSFAVALMGGAATALTSFSRRRRRSEATAGADQQQARTDAIRDGSTLEVRRQDQSELEAERQYGRETRQRAEAAEAAARRLEDELARHRRRTDDRLDDLRDQLRAFARTVLTCPVPNPPGCPLGPMARDAMDQGEPFPSPDGAGS